MRISTVFLILVAILTASCGSEVEDPYSNIYRVSYQFDESDTEGSLFIIDNRDKKFLLLYGVYTDTRPDIIYKNDVAVGHILQMAQYLGNSKISIRFYRFLVSQKFDLAECEVVIDAGDLDPTLLNRGNQLDVENMLEERDYEVGNPKCESKQLISDDNIVWEAKPDLQ